VATDARQIEYEVEERSIAAIVGAILLTMAITAIGFVPIFVGVASEKRDPGGGYVVLGAMCGVSHVLLGIVMLFEVLFTVGTGRGRTIGRAARAIGRVAFMPTVDFFLGFFAIGFGTLYMFAFTQTIADMPRIPKDNLGYVTDGFLGIWIVWAAILLGCFFWALWIDATLGREPRPKRQIEAAADDDMGDDDDAYYIDDEEPAPARRR
jgi:hypothetical protein